MGREGDWREGKNEMETNIENEGRDGERGGGSGEELAYMEREGERCLYLSIALRHPSIHLSIHSFLPPPPPITYISISQYPILSHPYTH